MSKVKNNQAIGISRWQSSRMKMILTERWLEVWEAVETRVYKGATQKSGIDPRESGQGIDGK